MAPSHAYGNAGTYVVTLTVTDNKGATGSDSATMTIANRPPTANAGSDLSGAPGVAMTFNGSGSSDPDGTITSYTWSFGDGTSGSGAVANHVYATAGTYTVTLTVRDDDGAIATDSAAATVTASTSGTWSRSQGSIDSDSGTAVAVDAAGNVFVGGTFRGTMDLGTASVTSAGGADWFLAKYSPSGALLWVRNMGGTSEDSLESIAVDPAGDVVATGRFAATASLGGASLVANGSLDIGIAKYNGATGAHLWSKRFGGAYDDTGAAVAVDSTGNVYLTGYFRGVVDFGGGTMRVPYDTDLDVFVVKLDPTGAHLWSKNFPNTGNDRGYGLATNGASVAVVGSFSNGIDFGGGQLFSQNAMTDGFVAVLNAATGAYQWARQLGSPDGSETAYGVDFNTNGNVLVCGVAVKAVDFGGGSLAALGGADGFIAAYNGSGGHVWSRRLGGAGNDYAYGVAHASDGTVYVTGSFEGSASFGGAPLVQVGGGDVFVAKYNASGAALPARGLGGAGADFGQEIAVTPTGQPVVAGYFYGAGIFDGTSLTSLGMADSFVTKMNP